MLGGGIIAGSLVLIGGDPGIGKSTLLLQMCKNISDYDHEVLYVSGEESERQIKLRADRVGAQSSHLKVFCETSVSVISEVIESTKPDVVIIDSIQTMYSDNADSAPGSPYSGKGINSCSYEDCKAVVHRHFPCRSCYKGRCCGRTENA